MGVKVHHKTPAACRRIIHHHGAAINRLCSAKTTSLCNREQIFALGGILGGDVQPGDRPLCIGMPHSKPNRRETHPWQS